MNLFILKMNNASSVRQFFLQLNQGIMILKKID